MRVGHGIDRRDADIVADTEQAPLAFDVESVDVRAAQLRTGAEVIVETLEALGVRHIFGIPGGNVIPFYDALHSAAALRGVLVRHEEGAVHAAHGYAIASGAVGACVATSGPGATNLVTAMVDALADSAPMLVITGAVFSTLQGTDAFQEADIYGMTEGITKHSFRVTQPDDIAPTLREAHRIATSGRPGPVLIDITKDAQQGIAADGTTTLSGYTDTAVEAVSLDAELAQIARALSKAERPLLLAGTGVLRSDASAALRALADRAGAAVITSAAAHGVIATDDPLSIGVLGGPAAESALASCDGLIAVGVRASVVRDIAARVRTSSPIVQIDADPSELYAAPGMVRIAGDAKSTLTALVDLLPAAAERTSAWTAHLDAAVERPNDGVSPMLSASTALRTISELSPLGSTFVSEYPIDGDAGALTISRTSRFITSGGFVRSGFAIPAALGAKFARPRRTVWAVTDSAGFTVSARELATSAVEGAPINVAVLSRADAILAVPDVARLGEAFGAIGITVESASELSDAVDAALVHVDRSVVLEVRLAS